MMIGTQQQISTSFLNVVSKHRRLKHGNTALRLTSMIDMFTILLVFLLKSYSTEGQIITVSQDLRLPESTAQTMPRVASVIAITSEWILVDGRPVEKVSTVLSSSDLLILKLRDELLRLRAITEGLGALSTQMRGFLGNMTIQADREVTFDLLKRIMLTCGNVGYNNMMLAVNQKE